MPIKTVENVSQFGPFEPEEYLATKPDSRDFPLGTALILTTKTKSEEAIGQRMEKEQALNVVGLAKSFGSLAVASDVHLSVAVGERRGLIGVNGAGKTTLFNLISGELSPDHGEIRFFGRNITHDSVIQRTLRRAGANLSGINIGSLCYSQGEPGVGPGQRAPTVALEALGVAD